jgi:hypothetical protein
MQLATRAMKVHSCEIVFSNCISHKCGIFMCKFNLPDDAILVIKRKT